MESKRLYGYPLP